MKEIKKGLKKQIKDKETPLKKNQKNKKEYIIEYREFHLKDSIFVKQFGYKSGWNKWKNYKAYNKEKDMLNFLKIVNKLKITSFCGTKYEYRIKK